MSRFKEIELLNGIRDGKEDVLTKFYNENLPKISRFVISNSGCEEDAEDVFQDALLITYQKLKADSLQLDCSLSTYVFAVGRNLWMGRLRKNSKILTKNGLQEISEDSNQSIIEAINESEKQILFQKHFVKLGLDCQAILLNFFKEKSMMEISDLMKYSTGYARKKKFECKKRLIEMIEADPKYKELRTDDKKGTIQ